MRPWVMFICELYIQLVGENAELLNFLFIIMMKHNYAQENNNNLHFKLDSQHYEHHFKWLY